LNPEFAERNRQSIVLAAGAAKAHEIEREAGAGLGKASMIEETTRDTSGRGHGIY
jgi:hypothetical protein